jgi:hypothetical protein
MQASFKEKSRVGVATPAAGQIENQHEHNSGLRQDQQLILRDGLWELCSIFTACGVAAMAAAGGGSVEAIEADLRSAHLALREAVSTFKELRALCGGGPTQ